MMDQSTAMLERMAFEASQWAKANNIGADQPSLVFARRFAFMLEQQGLVLSPSRSPVGGEAETVADKLRSAFMEVQKNKREEELDLEPIWTIVNMVPAVLYELDHMAEFEREAASEEAEEAASPARVQGDVAGLILTLLKNAIREAETRGDTTVYLVKSTADRILSALAAPPSHIADPGKMVAVTSGDGTPSPSKADVGALVEAIETAWRRGGGFGHLAKTPTGRKTMAEMAAREALASFTASHDGGL